jgi:thiol-disulfide isomerase/thioredoxin
MLLAHSLLFPTPAAPGELIPGSLHIHAPLRLTDLEGREHDLGDLRGKVVILNFWASWCAPCVEEMPSIQRLSSALAAASVAVIAVNVGESELRVRAVAQRLGIELPILLDKDSTAFDAWGATVLPTTFVVDAEGRVRLVGRGPLEWDADAMIQRLESLVAGR